jgi:hypothetical protein
LKGFCDQVVKTPDFKLGPGIIFEYSNIRNTTEYSNIEKRIRIFEKYNLILLSNSINIVNKTFDLYLTRCSHVCMTRVNDYRQLTVKTVGSS